MQWTIPGTRMQMSRDDARRVDGLFASMFLPGGMVLSQVAGITGLEPYTIQNWVKRGFLSSPVQKRYSMNQLCRILHINMLRSILPMEQICGLLRYVNGALDDESDDIISASEMYFLFVKLAAQSYRREDIRQLVEESLADYVEPVSGAKERVTKAMQIMLLAWAAACRKQEAEEMLKNL